MCALPFKEQPVCLPKPQVNTTKRPGTFKKSPNHFQQSFPQSGFVFHVFADVHVLPEFVSYMDELSFNVKHKILQRPARPKQDERNVNTII